MLHSLDTINISTQLGIWKIEESKEDLLASLALCDTLCDILALNSQSRIAEMLAVRVLLKEMLGTDAVIAYYPSGKPYLANHSHNISISHSKNYVAVAIDKEQAIALDIEQISEKIKRVQSRFISENEIVDSKQELLHLTLHWSAKEAMYKYIDVSGVDFLKQLHVCPFRPVPSGIFACNETRTTEQQSFEAYYKVEEAFVVVCVCPVLVKI